MGTSLVIDVVGVVVRGPQKTLRYSRTGGRNEGRSYSAFMSSSGRAYRNRHNSHLSLSVTSTPLENISTMTTRAPVKRETYEPQEQPRRVALPAPNPAEWIYVPDEVTKRVRTPERKPEEVYVRV